MIRSYSQVDQDLWVLEMLNNKKNGYFLDVGAYDGIKYSNSLLLEKDFDWTGLLIEAHPNNFDTLKNNRKNTLVPYAVSDYNGKIIFENECGTGSKVVEKNGLSIDCITFEKMFEMYNVPNYIDYISLDIEGMEYLSLTKFPFDKYKFKLLTVEHNLYMSGSENKEKIKDILLKNGYVIYRENVSHNELPFEDWYINPNI
jgi:FkbM family methyltransferase